MKPLKGIHHVTAITGDAQRNVDFYCGVLGLRLVKKTVNFDDPGSYHLYFGDRFGSPGTLLTFFVWPGATTSRAGAGEPVAVAYEIPEGSLEFWRRRMSDTGTESKETTRFGAGVISASDPDGMQVELVETSDRHAAEYWPGGGVAKEHAIAAIHSVTLSVRDEERSASLYTGELTFRNAGLDKGRNRFAVGPEEPRNFVDLVSPSAASRGRMGAGTIHHVAFRTDDDTSQNEWLQRLTNIGMHVSPVMDRKYFHSIYFRERNGVLFEIATEGPGMTVDEAQEHLGESLTLPAEYERFRSNLERTLPSIASPQSLSAAR